MCTYVTNLGSRGQRFDLPKKLRIKDSIDQNVGCPTRLTASLSGIKNNGLAQELRRAFTVEDDF
jgi:hypothetical protein